jgi:hypothetical protein
VTDALVPHISGQTPTVSVLVSLATVVPVRRVSPLDPHPGTSALQTSPKPRPAGFGKRVGGTPETRWGANLGVRPANPACTPSHSTGFVQPSVTLEESTMDGNGRAVANYGSEGALAFSRR